MPMNDPSTFRTTPTRAGTVRDVTALRAASGVVQVVDEGAPQRPDRAREWRLRSARPKKRNTPLPMATRC
jgi:hypothetical protein